MAEIRILLISGSTRAASTNSAALRTAHALDLDGVRTVLYERLADLPALNPDDDTDTPPPPVVDLRAQIDGADAVLFCTPEYAGSLPGSFKNLLDWTVKGGQLYGKPVASINVADAGRGEAAQAMLRTVLGYVGAIPIEPACVRVTVPRDSVVADGLVDDDEGRSSIAEVLTTIATTVAEERAHVVSAA